MIRRPPRSPLFPYPPLFRSSEKLRLFPDHPVHTQPRDRCERCGKVGIDKGDGRYPVDAKFRAGVEAVPTEPQQAGARSEEHTSELQSLAYLVCRLLLEKKNN